MVFFPPRKYSRSKRYIKHLTCLSKYLCGFSSGDHRSVILVLNTNITDMETLLNGDSTQSTFSTWCLHVAIAITASNTDNPELWLCCLHAIQQSSKDLSSHTLQQFNKQNRKSQLPSPLSSILTWLSILLAHHLEGRFIILLQDLWTAIISDNQITLTLSASVYLWTYLSICGHADVCACAYMYEHSLNFQTSWLL